MSGPVPRDEHGLTVVAAAASEQRGTPRTAGEAADLADQYDRMDRLADLFDAAGEEMRRRAQLGSDILTDPAFVDSAPVAPPTHRQADDDIRGATLGPAGLLSRSLELDADAVVLRATVTTYRWIDDLQTAAYQTLGSIAGRAVGYLAPQVELGGAVVSAGLIEIDALDRDDVATYLAELAEDNPELLEHVTSGGGGLLDGLQMRAALTPGAPADDGRAAAGGLRALGVDTMAQGFGAALRDVAGGLVEAPDDEARQPGRRVPAGSPSRAPRGLGELMAQLAATDVPVLVREAGVGRFVAYLPGPGAGEDRRLRLVSGDEASYAQRVVAAVSRAVESAPPGRDGPARVMLVGVGQGGCVAAELASCGGPGWEVEQVVTAGSPAAHVSRLPASARLLALEDRSDPVALLGSLVNAGDDHRTTVVFDGGASGPEPSYVRGGRVADAATHPHLRAELDRLRRWGYLAR